MKTIAVLLTVYNRKEKTLQCLRNLYAQLPIEEYKVDVFLTNDGCTDGTPQAIEALFPEVNIIHSQGNMFWNRGMHMAWEMAAYNNYDYYLWLNDDTFLYEAAIETLLDNSVQTQEKAIICAPTCAAGTQQITYGGRRKGILIQPTGKIEECEHFNGNVVLIPRFVFQKVGNLDYTYTHALGDFDYGLRASKLGIKSYQSSRFIGTCERHEALPRWCSSRYSFNERRKVFHSPLGGHPREHFYFERKHLGLLPACFHYLTIHLRLITPHIWEKKNKR